MSLLAAIVNDDAFSIALCCAHHTTVCHFIYIFRKTFTSHAECYGSVLVLYIDCGIRSDWCVYCATIRAGCFVALRAKLCVLCKSLSYLCMKTCGRSWHSDVHISIRCTALCICKLECIMPDMIWMEGWRWGKEGSELDVCQDYAKTIYQAANNFGMRKQNL